MAIDQHFQNMFDAAAYNTAAWNDSGVTGYGIRLSSTRQFGMVVATDDNATALTANWYSAVFGQHLVGVDTNANVSVFGVTGEVHIGADYSSLGNSGGVYGYTEIGTTFTAGTAGNVTIAAVMAGMDLPSGAVLATNSRLAAFACGGSFGGTHTGKVCVLQVMNPGAGAYDYFMQIGNPGGAQADSTGITTAQTGVTTVAKSLKCCIGGTAYYIPMCTGTT